MERRMRESKNISHKFKYAVVLIVIFLVSILSSFLSESFARTWTDNDGTVYTTVPRDSLASDAQGNNKGLYAVYSDGTIMPAEGPIDHGPREPGGSAPCYYQDQLGLWAGKWDIWGIFDETMTGYLYAPITGTYKFMLSADDQAWLTFNGVLLITAPYNGHKIASIDLVGGRWYPIQITYQNRSGSNWLSFWWHLPETLETRYKVIEIAGLSESDIPTAMNDKGQIVGIGYNPSQHGFLLQDGQIQELPSFPQPPNGYSLVQRITDINNAGRIAGAVAITENYDYGAITHAVIWEYGVLSDLYTETIRGETPYAINEGGVAVGGAYLGLNNGEHAVIFHGAGGITDLNPEFNSHLTFSTARDINDAGQIVGEFTNIPAANVRHAVLWQNGTMTDLGIIGEGTETFAIKINKAGQILIRAQVPYSYTGRADRALLWENGIKKDLGILDGINSTIPTDINDAGQVVGYSGWPHVVGADGATPFLYEKGKIKNLNNLLVSDYSNWKIFTVSDINNKGEILAYGSPNRGSYPWKFVLLIPANGPAESTNDIKETLSNKAKDFQNAIQNKHLYYGQLLTRKDHKWNDAAKLDDINKEDLADYVDKMGDATTWTSIYTAALAFACAAEEDSDRKKYLTLKLQEELNTLIGIQDSTGKKDGIVPRFCFGDPQRRNNMPPPLPFLPNKADEINTRNFSSISSTVSKDVYTSLLYAYSTVFSLINKGKIVIDKDIQMKIQENVSEIMKNFIDHGLQIVGTLKGETAQVIVTKNKILGIFNSDDTWKQFFDEFEHIDEPNYMYLKFKSNFTDLISESTISNARKALLLMIYNESLNKKETRSVYINFNPYPILEEQIYKFFPLDELFEMEKDVFITKLPEIPFDDGTIKIDSILPIINIFDTVLHKPLGAFALMPFTISEGSRLSSDYLKTKWGEGLISGTIGQFLGNIIGGSIGAIIGNLAGGILWITNAWIVNIDGVSWEDTRSFVTESKDAFISLRGLRNTIEDEVKLATNKELILDAFKKRERDIVSEINRMIRYNGLIDKGTKSLDEVVSNLNNSGLLRSLAFITAKDSDAELEKLRTLKDKADDTQKIVQYKIRDKLGLIHTLQDLKLNMGGVSILALHILKSGEIILQQNPDYKVLVNEINEAYVNNLDNNKKLLFTAENFNGILTDELTSIWKGKLYADVKREPNSLSWFALENLIRIDNQNAGRYSALAKQFWEDRFDDEYNALKNFIYMLAWNNFSQTTNPPEQVSTEATQALYLFPQNKQNKPISSNNSFVNNYLGGIATEEDGIFTALPIPIDIRPTVDFMWSEYAHKLNPGEVGNHYPGVDYLLAYGLGKYHGYLKNELTEEQTMPTFDLSISDKDIEVTGSKTKGSLINITAKPHYKGKWVPFENIDVNFYADFLNGPPLTTKEGVLNLAQFGGYNDITRELHISANDINEGRKSDEGDRYLSDGSFELYGKMGEIGIGQEGYNDGCLIVTIQEWNQAILRITKYKDRAHWYAEVDRDLGISGGDLKFKIEIKGFKRRNIDNLPLEEEYIRYGMHVGSSPIFDAVAGKYWGDSVIGGDNIYIPYVQNVETSGGDFGDRFLLIQSATNSIGSLKFIDQESTNPGQAVVKDVPAGWYACWDPSDTDTSGFSLVYKDENGQQIQRYSQGGMIGRVNGQTSGGYNFKIPFTQDVYSYGGGRDDRYLRYRGKLDDNEAVYYNDIPFTIAGPGLGIAYNVPPGWYSVWDNKEEGDVGSFNFTVKYKQKISLPETTWTIPDDLQHKFYVNIDPDNLIPEYDKENNIAFSPVNTQSGNNIEFSDSKSGTNLTFSKVTSGGDTQITQTKTGPLIPAGFVLLPLGTYYQIETTATYSGNIQISIHYDDSMLPTETESTLKLMRYDEITGSWVDVTTSLDTVNNIIYGETNHLSFFGIMYAKKISVFKEFSLKHWRINWDQGKHDKNRFYLVGKIDLPDDYILDMLQKTGIVTITIEKRDSTSFSQTATLDFKQKGPIWHYKVPKAQIGTEQPLDIERMLIFWRPEGPEDKSINQGQGKHKRSGWFMIQGNINISDTDQAGLLPKAALTLNIPVENITVAGALESTEEVEFKTNKNLWFYNAAAHHRWQDWQENWWEKIKEEKQD